MAGLLNSLFAVNFALRVFLDPKQHIPFPLQPRVAQNSRGLRLVLKLFNGRFVDLTKKPTVQILQFTLEKIDFVQVSLSLPRGYYSVTHDFTLLVIMT